MNPDAKEFVPAHILKRRQEEKEAKEAEEALNDVTAKLDKVELSQQDKQNESTSCRVSGSNKTSTKNEASREVQNSSNENVKPNSTDHSSSTSQIQNGHQNHGNHVQQYASNNNNRYEGDYPEEPQDLNGEDDRFLLNAGENICEFNGEQFIVPGE